MTEKLTATDPSAIVDTPAVRTPSFDAAVIRDGLARLCRQPLEPTTKGFAGVDSAAVPAPDQLVASGVERLVSLGQSRPAALEVVEGVDESGFGGLHAQYVERIWSRLMWSGSGAGIGPELSETFLNRSQWSRRDLRIACLGC